MLSSQKHGFYGLKGGFTLIELLIVIAIILILIAIALPNFLAAQARAKVEREKSDQRSLATAIESLRTEYNFLLVDFWDDEELRINAARFGTGGGSVPNASGDPPRFQACCSWHRGNFRGGTTGVFTPLTTPIPYMREVPRDPFHLEGPDPDLVSDDELAPVSYMYHDRELEDLRLVNFLPTMYWKGVFGCYRGGECLPGTHGIERPLGQDQFYLVGIGPDGKREFFSPIPYAPTNGTTSYGDVIFRSDG